MNSKIVLALAVFATIGSTGARADEADNSQYAVRFEGSRSRAEVMAEAAAVPATRGTEPLGSRIAPPVQSAVDAKVLRAQAAEALRMGQLPHGEAQI